MVMKASWWVLTAPPHLFKGVVMGPGCCLCGSCCVVGRFIVTECYTSTPVAGATITVENEDGDNLGSGTTDDTGTVAIRIDGRPGMKFNGVITMGADTEEWEFIGRCGVNEVNVDFGASQEICIEVLDSITQTPVSGIPVIMYREVGNPVRLEEVERGTSDGGEVCFQRNGGGIFQVAVNAGPGANPDYAGGIGYSEISAPSCEDSTHKVYVSLITNVPGSHLVIVNGCHCGLAGATVTIKIMVYKPTSLGGCYSNDGSPPVYMEATMTTDSSGRAWFTPEIAGIPFFGNQYNPDSNQHECYQVVDWKAEGPSPYIPQDYGGYVPYSQNFYYGIHLYTSNMYHCNGGGYCLDPMPESVTAVISGSPGSPGPPAIPGLDGTYTLNRVYFSPGNPSDTYELCIPTGTHSALLFLYNKARLGWCEPFDYRWGWFGIYRMFIPCNWTGIADFQTSEKIVDLIGRASLGGTGGCPLNWNGQQFDRFWNGSNWIDSWGAIMVNVTGS